jgi:hypothetical protein
MTALVVYESVIGSTKAVAEAIAEGLTASGQVKVIEVGVLAATPGSRMLPSDVTLLVVGGPTLGFGLSRPNNRQDEASSAHLGVTTSGKGLREWLDALSLPTGGLPVAAFDTRINKPTLPGSSAAKSAEKRLKALGGRPASTARSFRLDPKGTELLTGELEAARAWGQELGGARARLR